MARPIIATPPGQPLTDKLIPSGLQRAFPPVAACWQHETGRWLCVQQIGRTALVGWRIKAYWVCWPHDVVTFDESADPAENLQAAIAAGAGILQIGPSEDVQEAARTARDKNRVNARNSYRRKIENRPPSKRSLKAMAREAFAEVIGGKAGAALLNGDAKQAAEGSPAPKQGRPRLPLKVEQDKAKRYTALIAQQASLAGVPAELCEAYSQGKGGLIQVSEWLKTEAGRTAHAVVLAQVEEEFRPQPVEGA